MSGEKINKKISVLRFTNLYNLSLFSSWKLLPPSNFGFMDLGVIFSSCSCSDIFWSDKSSKNSCLLAFSKILKLKKKFGRPRLGKKKHKKERMTKQKKWPCLLARVKFRFSCSVEYSYTHNKRNTVHGVS